MFFVRDGGSLHNPTVCEVLCTPVWTRAPLRVFTPDTMLAVAEEHVPAGVNPLVAVVFGAAPATPGPPPQLRIVRCAATAGGTPECSVQEGRTYDVPSARSSVVIRPHPESSLSAAYTVAVDGRAGHLLVNLETFGRGTSTTYWFNATALRGGGSMAVASVEFDQFLSRRRAASGGPLEPGPGTVPALVYDGRTGIIRNDFSGRVQFLLQRVRAVGAAPILGEIALTLFQTSDGFPDEPHFDRDEVSTIGWGLCATIANTSHGLRGGDLQSNPFRATRGLGCPSSQFTMRDWPMIVNRLQPIICPNGVPCGAMTDPMLAAVADLLSDPAFFSGPPEDVINSKPPAPWGVGNGVPCAIGANFDPVQVPPANSDAFPRN